MTKQREYDLMEDPQLTAMDEMQEEKRVKYDVKGVPGFSMSYEMGFLHVSLGSEGRNGASYLVPLHEQEKMEAFFQALVEL